MRRRTLARIGLTIVVAAIWFQWLLPTGFGGPVGVTWVSGTSMEPGLNTGDLVVTYARDSYEVGNVVSFEIPSGGVVIHRVIEITDDGLYRFRGDNRDYQDPWALPAESIVGVSIFELHHAADVIAVLTRPISLALMVTAIVGLWLWQRHLDEDAMTDDEIVIDLTGEDDEADRVVVDLTDLEPAHLGPLWLDR